MSTSPFIKPGRIFWFVHPSTSPPIELGFIRDNRGGAFVIGGKTGSHYTGHGESWWKKLREIADLGYVPIEIAEKGHAVSSDWKPPPIDSKDALIVSRIEKGEI